MFNEGKVASHINAQELFEPKTVEQVFELSLQAHAHRYEYLKDAGMSPAEAIAQMEKGKLSLRSFQEQVSQELFTGDNQ